MNNLFMILALLIQPIYLFAQESSLSVGRTTKIHGVETYIMSEPLRPYEVVYDAHTGLKATSLITRGFINSSISDKASQFVRLLMKETAKDSTDYDAIIYSSGKHAVAIKFKDTVPYEKTGLARVRRINGIYAFILCEPLIDYNVIATVTGGTKGKSLVTGGLVNNGIEEDVTQLAKKMQKKAKKKKQAYDAIVYSNGKSGIGVEFKE